MRISGFSAIVIVIVLSACTAFDPGAPQAVQADAPVYKTLLSVKIPVRNAVATLGLIATSQGVQTWQTGDGVSVSLRDGLIVSTRGLGFDVMGSDVQQSLHAISGTLSGSYTVKRRYLTADNRSASITATCTMSTSGTDRVFIEECTTLDSTFRNEYLLDASGRIAQSIQWIGPEIEYLGLSYVNNG